MPRDVIFEIYRLGNVAKASAIDQETLIEVSVVGPANANELTLRRAALRKLESVLARRAKLGKPAR